MLLTLAVLVFFGSIVIFFSGEFIRAFKKIFAIRGVKLFLPLFAASWLVYTFDYWALWAVFYYREVLHKILSFLTNIMPFETVAPSIALILLLTFVSVVPVYLIDLILHKRTFKHYRYPHVTRTLIWITSAVLLAVI